MAGQNKTPLVGWHPKSADLVAWLEAEVERRGGGRGVRSTILEEALTAYRAAVESSRPGQPAAPAEPVPVVSSGSATAPAAMFRTATTRNTSRKADT